MVLQFTQKGRGVVWWNQEGKEMGSCEVAGWWGKRPGERGGSGQLSHIDRQSTWWRSSYLNLAHSVHLRHIQ